MGYASIFVVILFIAIACPIAAMRGLGEMEANGKSQN